MIPNTSETSLPSDFPASDSTITEIEDASGTPQNILVTSPENLAQVTTETTVQEGQDGQDVQNSEEERSLTNIRDDIPADLPKDKPVSSEPKPSYVKLAMRNMVKKRGLSLQHFFLTAIALLGFLVGLSYLTR